MLDKRKTHSTKHVRLFRSQDASLSFFFFFFFCNSFLTFLSFPPSLYSSPTSFSRKQFRQNSLQRCYFSRPASLTLLPHFLLISKMRQNTQISVLSIIIIIVIIRVLSASSWWSRRNHKRNDAHMDDDLVWLSFCSVFTSLFVIIIFVEKVMSCSSLPFFYSIYPFHFSLIFVWFARQTVWALYTYSSKSQLLFWFPSSGRELQV